MTLEHLQELSSRFGDELRRAFSELEKEVYIAGGGLRHGDVEWQVRYHYGDGLERFIFFTIDQPADRFIHLLTRAAASDEEGRWAYLPVGSVTIPEEIVKQQLDRIVRSFVEQGRTLANMLRREDVRPLVNDFLRTPSE